MFSKAAYDCFPLKSDFYPPNNLLSFTCQYNSLPLLASQILKTLSVLHPREIATEPREGELAPELPLGCGVRSSCLPGAREPKPLCRKPVHTRAHAPPAHIHAQRFPQAIQQLRFCAAWIYPQGCRQQCLDMLTKPAPDPLKAISFSISHPKQNSTWIFFFSVLF